MQREFEIKWSFGLFYKGIIYFLDLAVFFIRVVDWGYRRRASRVVLWTDPSQYVLTIGDGPHLKVGLNTSSGIPPALCSAGEWNPDQPSTHPPPIGHPKGS